MAKQVHQDAIYELKNLFHEYMTKSYHPSSKTESYQQQLIKLIEANSTLITENISFFYSILEFLSDTHPKTADLIKAILPNKSLSKTIDSLATKITNGDEASANELTHLLSANVQEVFANLYAFKSLWKLTEGEQNTQAIFAKFANAHNEAIVSSQYMEPALKDILSCNLTLCMASEQQRNPYILDHNKHYNNYIYNFLEKNLQQIINLNSSSSDLLACILYSASSDKEINKIVDYFFESNISLFFSNNLLLKHLIKNALENSDSGQKAKERLFTNLINYKKEILSLPEALSSFAKIIDQAPEFQPVYTNFLKKPMSLDEAREVFLESDNAEYLAREFTSLLFFSLPPGPERDTFISAALNKHAKIILTNQYATIDLFKLTPLPILIKFLENNISLVTKQYQPLSIIMNLISIIPDIALPKELITNIFNQETLATLKIKSKTPVELLKKWGIQTNLSINKIVIDDKIVTNPITKSILSKINAHFATSEQENIALQHNLSQCLEMAMQHNDIKAVLGLSTYYTKTIDVYKGLSANSTGDYSLINKTISIEAAAPFLLANHSTNTAAQCANITAILIHELMHQILDNIFGNKCEPFLSNDLYASKKFEAIKELIVEEYHKHHCDHLFDKKNTPPDDLPAITNGELAQYLPNALENHLANGNVHYITHSYIKEQYNAEIPAYYITQLSQSQFTSNKGIFAGQLLLQNQSLKSYMDVLFKIIHEDEEVLSNIEKYIPNHNIVHLVLDYSREHNNILEGNELTEQLLLGAEEQLEI